MWSLCCYPIILEHEPKHLLLVQKKLVDYVDTNHVSSFVIVFSLDDR